MDFVSDQLSDGTKFRTLTIVDVFSGEALSTEVEQRCGGEHVVAALNFLSVQRQAPKYLFVHNGNEFSARLLDLWTYHQQTMIDFSRPGKPNDNCYAETFNGSIRYECLNLRWFESLEEAKVIIEAWRRDYNESQSHMDLGDESPVESSRKLGASAQFPSVKAVENKSSIWSEKSKRFGRAILASYH